MEVQSIRILLVEDDPIQAVLTKEALARNAGIPYETEHVSSLEEARQTIRRGEHDILLLDLNLPDSDGLETISAISSDFSYLPVIVITSMGADELGLQAVQEGAQDYLIKGEIDRATLTRSINYAYFRRRFHDKAVRHTALEPVRHLQQEPQTESGILHVPLSLSAPDLFQQICRDYGEVLTRSSQAESEFTYNAKSEVERLAVLIGERDGGPRDVIEIHGESLKEHTSDVPLQQAQAMAEAARRIILQLMGELVDYYREK